jgi:TetR/AcrR family transcriptional regulator
LLCVYNRVTGETLFEPIIRGELIELVDFDAIRTGPLHDDIIQAAMKVFSRTNYDKATTAMIAKEAGVAEGTPFRYFGSKKGLFLACFHHIEQLLADRYAEIYEATKDKPSDYLRGVARSYVEFLRENPNMRKFLAFVLSNSFDEDFLSELKDFMYLNLRTTESMLEKAIEKGEAKEDIDPKAVAWLFVGGYFTFILMTELDVDELEDPHYVDRMLALVLK